MNSSSSDSEYTPLQYSMHMGEGYSCNCDDVRAAKLTKYPMNSKKATANEEDASYWRLWKNYSAYRWYLMSSLATDVGEWFSYIASIATIEQIHSIQNQSISRTSISILVALRLVPNALFSNVGGALADKFDRRNMLLALDILGAFVVLFFLLAYKLNSILALYSATVCQMTIAAFYEPCRSALVPMLVSDERYLKKALTLTGLTWSIMASIGASTGGLVTKYFGVESCFLINTVTYVLSAGFIWRIEGDYVAVEQAGSEEHELGSTNQSLEDESRSRLILDERTQILSLDEVLQMIIDGFSYLRSKQWGAFIFLKSCAALIYGSAEILNVAFSERRTSNGSGSINLEDSSARLGIIFGSVGVGCFLGPVISEVFTDMEDYTSLESACLLSYFLMGIGYWGIAQIGSFLSLCVFTAIRAAGSSIIWINSSLLLQKFSSNNMLGRVMAVDYALATLSEAMSAMSVGLLLDKAKLSPEAVSLAMCMLAIVVLALWTKYFYARCT